MKYPGGGANVEEFVDDLPPETRAVLSKLRALSRHRIPKGCRESLA